LLKQSTENASKPNTYNVNNNDEVCKVMTMHVNNKRLFKHGKKITARYDVSDTYTNGTLDLGEFFQGLEKQAGTNKIFKLKVAPWRNIFEQVLIDNLKKMENKIMKSLRVALLKPVTVIKNKEERYSRVPRLLDTRYSAKGTKEKWRYAHSKAGLKCATYRW